MDGKKVLQNVKGCKTVCPPHQVKTFPGLVSFQKIHRSCLDLVRSCSCFFEILYYSMHSFGIQFLPGHGLSGAKTFQAQNMPWSSLFVELNFASV